MLTRVSVPYAHPTLNTHEPSVLSGMLLWLWSGVLVGAFGVCMKGLWGYPGACVMRQPISG